MDPIQALQWVQSFYEQSWNKLLWVVGAGFAFGGIIFPFIFQRLQSKTFSKESKGRIEEAVTKLEKKFDDRIKSEREEMQKSHNNAMGGVFTVQSQIDFQFGNYAGSLTDCVLAVENYGLSKNYLNCDGGPEFEKRLLKNYLIQSILLPIPSLPTHLRSKRLSYRTRCTTNALSGMLEN